MGEHWYDWLLPIRYSPCTNHNWGDSQFATGPVVDRMREEAGIAILEEMRDEKGHRRKGHRRRHHRHHRRNGNGCSGEPISEKHRDKSGKQTQDVSGDMIENGLQADLGETNGRLN